MSGIEAVDGPADGGARRSNQKKAAQWCSWTFAMPADPNDDKECSREPIGEYYRPLLGGGDSKSLEQLVSNLAKCRQNGILERDSNTDFRGMFSPPGKLAPFRCRRPCSKNRVAPRFLWS
jgi:hypothetical protein